MFSLRPRFVPLVLTAAVLIIAQAREAAADGKVRLFILSGQSNMAGLKPELSFTPTVEKEFAGDEVLVVKYAIGGQPIRRWYEQWKLPEGAVDNTTTAKRKPGDMYATLMQKVRAAVGERRVESVAFVWMQGENDAKMGWHAAYAEALAGIVDQLRRDLQRDDIAVVVGRLSDCNNGRPSWDAIRAAQEKVAVEQKLGAWVDTDDLNDVNGKHALHYTGRGYVELGRRFAAEAIKLNRRGDATE